MQWTRTKVAAKEYIQYQRDKDEKNKKFVTF